MVPRRGGVQWGVRVLVCDRWSESCRRPGEVSSERSGSGGDLPDCTSSLTRSRSPSEAAVQMLVILKLVKGG